MHAKYQCSIINTSEDMSQVKVFVTDGQTDGRTDRGTDGRMRFNVPTLSQKAGDNKVAGHFDKPSVQTMTEMRVPIICRILEEKEEI